jgi:DNA polymerase-1
MAPVELVFDLEGASADQLYKGNHEGPFVRLLGIQKPHGGISILAGPGMKREYVQTLAEADVKIGHNILAFDIPALARHEGGDYAKLSEGAVDTMVLARLADPPGARGQKPWSTPGYYSLDAVAARVGVPGKTDDLAGLAARHGGYDRIPVDDPDYRAYLRGDLSATRAVYEALKPALTPYARREMRVVSIQNRMTFNGWRIDVPLLADRVRIEEEHRLSALESLHDGYGLPRTGGKAPLGSKAGKEWFAEGLASQGIAPVMTKPTEAHPNGQVSVSGAALTELGNRPGISTEAASILALMTEVAGVTAKYQEIQNHLIEDRVHGGIGADQASGRWAMTRPSLTNIGKRGEKKVAQRAVFLPEPGHVLISFDLDQVDMRAIAALSQDTEYMKLFEPGRDAHSEIAMLVFGRSDGDWRDKSKRCGHGWNYGMSVNGLIRSGVDPQVAQQFDTQMTHRFPVLCSKREEWRAYGSSGALLDNGFGRTMRCDPNRSHTQAPALMGQGGARDLMCEGLLRLDPAIHPMLRAVVHDEVVCSVPSSRVDEISEHIQQALTFEWRGVRITCGASKPGINWAACYSKD